MNSYVTGSMIRRIREQKNMTQAQLADRLCISDKTVSRWETGRGYPDVSLLEPLASALGVSMNELLSGRDVTNRNTSFNMKRMKFYACPVCGNILFSSGEADISCCGTALSALVHEKPDEEHAVLVEKSEDEYVVTFDHPMSRDHYISFAAAVKDNGVEVVKLYPEGSAQVRFRIARTSGIYYFCSRHGLYYYDIRKASR